MASWNTLAEMSYGREVWEARLREAEQQRRLRSLPRRKPLSLRVWIRDRLRGAGALEPTFLREAKA